MKTNRFQACSRALALALAATSGILGFASGCGSSVSGAALCEQICTCQGCTKTETQACEAEFGKAEKLSGDQGCDDAYGTYVDCFSTKLECVDDKIDAGACAAEVTALITCTKTIPISVPGSSACDAYEKTVKSCVCAPLQDATAKADCEATIDQQISFIKGSSSAEDACRAALSAISGTCP